jgi:hypothetical protein
MTQLEIKFVASELPDFVAQLEVQPDAVRPTEIAVDEESVRKPISPEDLRDIHSLIAQYPSGFALYGTASEFHLSHPDTGDCSLFALIGDDRTARCVFRGLGKLNLLYGYACRPDEMAHRNRIVAQKKYGAHEAWVGRDFRKWLPGVYWINVVPSELLERHGLRIEEFNSIAHSIELIENKNYLIELYASSDQWVSNSDKIDHWCEGHSGVFGRAQAKHDFDQAQNFLESSRVLERWR